jgi:type IV pilus assembly protein PilQ
MEAPHRKATLLATTLETTATGARIFLRVPGMAAEPGVQVLTNPHRVVLDLPGVDRGSAVTRKDLALLVHPLIQKTRLAQFSVEPRPVTRLVLEVLPGTQVLVASLPDGVQVLLTAGVGRVQARLERTPLPGNLLATAAPELASAASAAMPVTEAVAPQPIPAPTAAPAPSLAMAAAPEPLPAAPIQPSTPVQVAAPPVAAVSRPLAPLPAFGTSIPLLPQLATATLLTAQAPEAEKPQAQAPTRTAGRTLGEASAKYSGARMTVSLTNTDIREFLNIVADAGKLNLVMDPDVQGTFGYRFTDTPWDQILDVVLKNAGFGKEIQNGVLRVAKIEKLQKEEEERKKLDETKALAGELQTITRPLSYAKVGEVQKILKDMLTKRGSAILDDRTNTLIITDLPRNISVIDELLQTLDVQIQQVQIEARVVEANKNWQRAFGVKWPQSNSGNASISSSTGTSSSTPWVGGASPFWNGTTAFQRDASGQSAALAWAPGKDGVTSIAAPAGELWLSFLSNRFSINAVLQALESEGTLKIVSSPKVVTQNNKKATILSGEKIPYPTQQGGAAGGAITVAFIDANLQLDVTPQVTSEGTIIMDLKVEKAEADFSRTVNGTPTILRKSIETQVLVRDGGTAVLGGVYITNSNTGNTGVPFLSKLPLIGFLFRTTSRSETNTELLIFITPRVVKQ